MLSGIYCIKNKLDGKCYIGLSNNFIKRIAYHFKILRLGKHYNIHLQRAFTKDGENNFEWHILFECSISSLDYLERFYIKIYRANDRIYGYNIEAGGNISKITSEETKQKLSIAWKFRPQLSKETREKIADSNRGKKRSAEIRKRFCDAQKNRPPISEETRRKMSVSQKGRIVTEETRIKISSHIVTDKTRKKLSVIHTGRKHTDATKRKISAIRRAMGPISEETRKKMSDSHKYPIQNNIDNHTKNLP